MKIRQNLYIERKVSEAIEAIAGGPGANKSRLVNEALAAWLARRGTKEIDDLFKGRLDLMSREIAGARRDIEIVLESLALLVRYQLTVTAPLAEGDEAGRAQGRARFEAFIIEVGRQLAAGRRTLAPAEPVGGRA